MVEPSTDDDRDGPRVAGFLLVGADDAAVERVIAVLEVDCGVRAAEWAIDVDLREAFAAAFPQITTPVAAP